MEILVSEMGPHVCNYSSYVFEQATKMLGEESQCKKHVLQNMIRARSKRGRGQGCFPVTWDTGEDTWQPLAFIFICISATENTESRGKAVANKCVEIFIPIKLSLCLPTQGDSEQVEKTQMELVFMWVIWHWNKTQGARNRQPGFKSWLYHLLPLTSRKLPNLSNLQLPWQIWDFSSTSFVEMFWESNDIMHIHFLTQGTADSTCRVTVRCHHSRCCHQYLHRHPSGPALCLAHSRITINVCWWITVNIQ